MSKKNKKQREYFYSGTWEDRLPAIFYSCMIIGAWIYIMIKDKLETVCNIDFPIIIEFIIWGILSFILFKICIIIKKFIIDKKKTRGQN